MRYRPFANTGLFVSELCLGTMTWGSQNSEAEAHAQLDFAWERGVNFLDTAEGYPTTPAKAETQGLTEAYIGSWLAARCNRDKVILATKVAGPVRPGDARRFRPDGNHLTRANIEAGVDGSLRRLRTDYIDLYQVHWPEIGRAHV